PVGQDERLPGRADRGSRTARAGYRCTTRTRMHAAGAAAARRQGSRRARALQAASRLRGPGAACRGATRAAHAGADGAVGDDAGRALHRRIVHARRDPAPLQNSSAAMKAWLVATLVAAA